MLSIFILKLAKLEIIMKKDKKFEKIVSMISFSLIQLLFIFAKLFNIIDEPWLLVLSPILSIFIFCILSFLVLLIIENHSKNI